MRSASRLAAWWVGIPMKAVLLKVSDGVDEFSLLAIPFFVLAGALMAEGGIAIRLVNFANIFVGFIRGGLAMVNILASMFFGGISGSSVADTSSIGSIMIPMMKRQGYDDAFSVNVTITSSTLRAAARHDHPALGAVLRPQLTDGARGSADQPAGRDALARHQPASCCSLHRPSASCQKIATTSPSEGFIS